MSNHVHLLMQFPSLRSFSQVTKRVHLLYAKFFSRKYHHTGHVFQDRFKSYPVETESYLLECGRYIERNPLKAALCNHPADYRWSSAAHYLGKRFETFLTDNPYFAGLGRWDDERRNKYEEYLLVERPYEQEIERLLFGKQLVR
jgi:putative transposase